MQEMVFEQGQIVDRIDYNIDQALIRVEKGNKELVQVFYFFGIYVLGKRLPAEQVCSLCYQVPGCYGTSIDPLNSAQVYLILKLI